MDITYKVPLKYSRDAKLPKCLQVIIESESINSSRYFIHLGDFGKTIIFKDNVEYIKSDPFPWPKKILHLTGEPGYFRNIKTGELVLGVQKYSPLTVLTNSSEVPLKVNKNANGLDSMFFQVYAKSSYIHCETDASYFDATLCLCALVKIRDVAY